MACRGVSSSAPWTCLVGCTGVNSVEISSASSDATTSEADADRMAVGAMMGFLQRFLQSIAINYIANVVIAHNLTYDAYLLIGVHVILCWCFLAER
jgi:hypothetical protein